MSKSKGLFIACDEAKHNCDKTQYNDASFWEKIKLSVHLIYCRACRKYSKNNNKLTELVNNKDVECLDIKEKEHLIQSFENELAKHQ